MQRIAPNNQLPATHFIEVWKGHSPINTTKIKRIEDLEFCLETTTDVFGKTIAIFRIRENQLPTKHKF